MTFIIHSRRIKNHKGQIGADKRGRDRRHYTLSKSKASSGGSRREAMATAGRDRRHREKRGARNVMSQVDFCPVALHV